MVLIRELYISTRMHSQVDAQLIVDLEKLEHLSLFLSAGEERGPSQHLMLRSISWTMLIWKTSKTYSSQLNVAQMIIWKILHGKSLYSYSSEQVHGLKFVNCSAQRLCVTGLFNSVQSLSFSPLPRCFQIRQVLVETSL
jgi:hypothetical protein